MELGSVWIVFERSSSRPRIPRNIPNMSALSPIAISSTSSSPTSPPILIPFEDIPPLSLYTPREVLESQVDKLTLMAYKVSPLSNPQSPC